MTVIGVEPENIQIVAGLNQVAAIGSTDTDRSEQFRFIFKGEAKLLPV